MMTSWTAADDSKVFDAMVRFISFSPLSQSSPSARFRVGWVRQNRQYGRRSVILHRLETIQAATVTVVNRPHRRVLSSCKSLVILTACTHPCTFPSKATFPPGGDLCCRLKRGFQRNATHASKTLACNLTQAVC